MTQEEIITRLIDLLDLHLQGGFGSIHQDPYKNDIFKLFREAYRKRYFESFSRPRLTGDALRDTLEVRWGYRQRNSKTRPRGSRPDNVGRVALCVGPLPLICG